MVGNCQGRRLGLQPNWKRRIVGLGPDHRRIRAEYTAPQLHASWRRASSFAINSRFGFLAKIYRWTRIRSPVSSHREYGQPLTVDVERN